ncbi:zinc finger protein OZF-like, partial [Nannospalax galili]|uniref:zinc finger protein OZF-like n=1 Tax=Nannospalax galili TaxID=1026970 RepID=UPI000819DFBE
MVSVPSRLFPETCGLDSPSQKLSEKALVQSDYSASEVTRDGSWCSLLQELWKNTDSTKRDQPNRTPPSSPGAVLDKKTLCTDSGRACQKPGETIVLAPHLISTQGGLLRCYSLPTSLNLNLEANAQKESSVTKQLLYIVVSGQLVTQGSCKANFMITHGGEEACTRPGRGDGLSHKYLLTQHDGYSQEKADQGTKCGKVLYAVSSSHKPRITPTAESPFVSYKDGKAFLHMSESLRYPFPLKEGELIQAGENPYKCSGCGKIFRTEAALQEHEQIHTEEKPYVCSQCGKAFGSRSVFCEHELLHRKEMPFVCDKCGKAFLEKSELTSHQQSHTGEKPYKCCECEKSFKFPSQLKVHCQIHTGEKPYECQECGKSFSKTAKLKVHHRIHTGEKPYVCSECGKAFNQKSILDRHGKLHPGEKPHRCSDCGKSFNYPSQLKVHYHSHTGEKPYKCRECGKSFNFPCELKVHYLNHTGEKPYKCRDCWKLFSKMSQLKAHYRVHTGERPFKCSHCGKAFSTKEQ